MFWSEGLELFLNGLWTFIYNAIVDVIPVWSELKIIVVQKFLLKFFVSCTGHSLWCSCLLTLVEGYAKYPMVIVLNSSTHFNLRWVHCNVWTCPRCNWTTNSVYEKFRKSVFCHHICINDLYDIVSFCVPVVLDNLKGQWSILGIWLDKWVFFSIKESEPKTSVQLTEIIFFVITSRAQYGMLWKTLW